MKKFIAAVLVALSAFGSMATAAFAGKTCGCQPCKCSPCECGK